MFNRYIFTLIVLLLPFVLPLHATAHVLKTDGPVGAVIHISPNDDPVAGDMSYFFFEFKDKSQKFIPADCDCTATIRKDGVEIYTQSLFTESAEPSLDDATFSYTLPERGTYSVIVSGKPYENGRFKPFTLEWDIRVSRTSLPAEDEYTVSESDNTATVVPMVLGMLVAGGGIGFVLYKRNLKK